MSVGDQDRSRQSECQVLKVRGRQGTLKAPYRSANNSILASHRSRGLFSPRFDTLGNRVNERPKEGEGEVMTTSPYIHLFTRAA